MTNDMTKGAITPLLIRFTIPLVLGNLFQLTYNAADSIIVGKFVGEEALAAVGTSNPLMTLAILFINGMCLGAGILVSTAFGAGNAQLMERQVSTTAIAGTVFSLAFSALCVILATPLLQLMQVPADILPIAVSYLRIVFAGLIFTFFYNFLAATMRALGDSKSALYFLMISSVLNIGGDLLLVGGFGLNVAGAAIATVIGQAFGALAGFLVANHADVVICGGIGGGAQSALTEAGIRFYGGVSGSADAAVQALLDGSLAYDPEARCDHHDHAHGAGHTCGEHGCGEHSCHS